MVDWRELCNTTILRILARVLRFAGCGGWHCQHPGKCSTHASSANPDFCCGGATFRNRAGQPDESFNLALGPGNEGVK
jgi:hypothetical protein